MEVARLLLGSCLTPQNNGLLFKKEQEKNNGGVSIGGQVGTTCPLRF